MIDSGLYSKPIDKVSQYKLIEIDDINNQLSESIVNKSAMFHIINSYIYTIFKSDDEPLKKKKYIYNFGFKIGFNMAEEECMGFMKHCVPKPQKHEGKEFVGQVKLLNSRVWSNIFGNKGKLYAISNESLKSVSYKIEDKEFNIAKCLRNSNDPQEIQYRQFFLQFYLGVIKGVLQKFLLAGEIDVGESNEGEVYAELKNLYRKKVESEYQETKSSMQEPETF